MIKIWLVLFLWNQFLIGENPGGFRAYEFGISWSVSKMQILSETIRAH